MVLPPEPVVVLDHAMLFARMLKLQRGVCIVPRAVTPPCYELGAPSTPQLPMIRCHDMTDVVLPR